MKSIFQIGIFSLLVTFSALGQSPTIPLNRDYYHLIDRYEILQKDFAKGFTTTAKPYTRKEVAQFADSLFLSGQFTSEQDKFNILYLLNDNWPFTNNEQNETKKVLLKHFNKINTDVWHIDNKEVNLRVNPVFNGMLGNDSEARKRPSFGNFTDTTVLQFPRIRTFELNYIRESKLETERKWHTRLNASIYYNSLQNLLSRVSSVNNLGESQFFSGNNRDVNTFGAEAGVDLSYENRLHIQLSGSINQSEETQIFREGTFTGQAPSYSPGALAYFKVSYIWQFEN